jgi:hypothetical protein
LALGTAEPFKMKVLCLIETMQDINPDLKSPQKHCCGNLKFNFLTCDSSENYVQ